MTDLLDRISQLDDSNAVQLFRRVGPLLFKQPDLRGLIEQFPPSAPELVNLANISREAKVQPLSPNRSIRLTRKLLLAIATDPRLADILAKLLQSFRPTLIADATIPRGLATDVVRLLASSRQSGTSSVTRSIDGDPLVQLAEEAVAEEAMARPRSATPAGATAGASPGHPAPPRSFYALVRSPDHVVMTRKFTMTIGTSKEGSGEPFHVPAAAPAEYVIVLSLDAPGFDVEGDTTRELSVTTLTPYPQIEVTLVPQLIAEEKVARTVTVVYSVGGEAIGSAQREIQVHAEEDEETKAAQFETWRRAFSAPADGVAPDLTVIVMDDGSGRLSWSFISKHDVPLQKRPLHTNAGAQTKAFAFDLVNQVEAREGKVGLFDFVVGIGKSIENVLPPGFSEILSLVAKKAAPHAPSLLLISNEPYIPWELATLPPPLIDPAAPPFLGAQTRMGRWVVGERLPPPRKTSPTRAAVIAGNYTGGALPNLTGALAEADEIGARYGADKVEATAQKILDALKGQPRCDLLHFSMHGICADSVMTGLLTTDGNAIAPAMVKGCLTPDSGTPFVFLNACQVAGGTRVLDAYSGLAAEFVNGGASAVIAPLWKIDDVLAHKLAVRFYEAVDSGEQPAEAIRQARLTIKNSLSGNYLAYQFFGHPELKLETQALRSGPVVSPPQPAPPSTTSA